MVYETWFKCILNWFKGFIHRQENLKIHSVEQPKQRQLQLR